MSYVIDRRAELRCCHVRWLRSTISSGLLGKTCWCWCWRLPCTHHYVSPMAGNVTGMSNMGWGGWETVKKCFISDFISSMWRRSVWQTETLGQIFHFCVQASFIYVHILVLSKETECLTLKSYFSFLKRKTNLNSHLHFILFNMPDYVAWVLKC